MRVVVAQGQYGVFPTDSLDLSMPAIQSCIGLFAEDTVNSYILCAHFDSNIRLRRNLDDIKQTIETKGLYFRNFRATVFGGEGKLSYLRCSTPSSYIGENLVTLLEREGCAIGYSDRYYSGIIPRTFNLHYKGGNMWVTEGQNYSDFQGIHYRAKAVCSQRIRKCPDQYSTEDAKLYNISDLYLL